MQNINNDVYCSVVYNNEKSETVQMPSGKKLVK
jgi:hypothetical protein